MTAENFRELENKVKEYKSELDSSLKKLLENISSESIDNAKKHGSNFFIEFESFIASASSEYDSLSKTQINDILNSIENILEFSILYWGTMKEVLNNNKLPQTFNPQNNFLKTAQGILKTYRKENALTIQKKFEKKRLPIEGFLSKEKYKLKSSKIDWTSIIIGIVLLIISSILIFTVLLNTGMQYWITRILASLGVAFLITGVSKDSIQAKINLPTAAITATGTIAVFFVLYFSNPADEPTYPNPTHQK